MGLVSRRRYRWQDDRIVDYWDEVFTDDTDLPVAPDEESAFIASLGGSRSAPMRDVLGTIATDQDAIIHAGSAGALVVDGGPGTGKTVVALHRTAYLLHSDTRIGANSRTRGGVLFVGPHLPEEPPTRSLVVETPWDEITVTARDWKEAFDWPDPGAPHNLARDQIWEQLLAICIDQHDDSDPDVTEDMIAESLLRNEELVTTFARAWPLLGASDLVGDLFEVPAYLRRCAPGVTEEQVQRLQRPDAAREWTESDLPQLDAARLRLGDPEAARRARRHKADAAAERARMDDVVADILAANDDPLWLLRCSLLDDALRRRRSLSAPRWCDDRPSSTTDARCSPRVVTPAERAPQKALSATRRECARQGRVARTPTTSRPSARIPTCCETGSRCGRSRARAQRAGR